MEIELLTTKKKLSKQLLSQFRTAGAKQLNAGTVLGFVLNSSKMAYKLIIISCGTDYYVVQGDWDTELRQCKSTNIWCIDRTHRRLKYSSGFNSKEEAEYWMSGYRRVLNLATNQIYI
jgi:hypothetical protein